MIWEYMNNISPNNFVLLIIPLNICLDDLKNFLYCHLTVCFSVSFIESAPLGIFFFFLNQGVLSLYQAEVVWGGSVPVLDGGEVQHNGAFYLSGAPIRKVRESALGCVRLFAAEGRLQSFNPDQCRKMECSWGDVSQKRVKIEYWI